MKIDVFRYRWLETLIYILCCCTVWKPVWPHVFVHFCPKQGSDQQHPNNADDTRRIIMRAANCQRSPRSAPPPLPEVQHSKTSTATGTTTSSRNNNNPTPLTSTGSTTSSSSGYSSINTADPMDHTATAVPNTVDYACPPTNNNNSVVPVPTVSSSSNESSSGNCRIIPIIKVKKKKRISRF